MTSLLLLALAVLLGSFQACASNMQFPATVEVDLVFPRNETYAPTPLLPVVFAFQNSALASVLVYGLTFNVTSPSLNINYGYSYELYLNRANFTASDPYYYYLALEDFNNTDIYTLTWVLDTISCEIDEYSDLIFHTASRTSSVDFTLKASGQKVDLAAATAASSSSATCANNKLGHFAFNFTGTQPNSSPYEYPKLKTCAVLSEPHPIVKGNPCAVQIDSRAASSISASLTASACLEVRPVVSCPGSTSAASSNKSLLVLDSIEKWATLTLLVSSILVVHHLWA